MRGLLLATACALLAPCAGAAAADPALPPVSLYLHPGGATDFVINTQPFPETALMPGGLGSTTLTCVPDPAPTSVGQEHNLYTARSEQGLARAGNGVFLPDEPRLADNVTLGPEPVLHWFLATRLSTPVGQLPAAAPRVVVEASLRNATGHAQGVGSRILASGASPPAALARQASSGATWTQAGGLDVYEVTVPLAWSAAPVLPRAGYTMAVRVRMDTGSGACDGNGGTVMPEVAGAYSDATHAPRLEARASAPPRVADFARPSDEGGGVFTASVTDPWGSYDADVGNATLSIAGTGGSWLASLAHATQRSPAEVGHAFDPILTAWAWNLTGVPLGDYTARLQVPNLQHTDAGEATLRFKLAAAKPSPAAGPVLLGIGLLAAARRRRA